MKRIKEMIVVVYIYEVVYENVVYYGLGGFK